MEKGNPLYPVQTVIRKVAREGRKFGIGLCVISQRPSFIDQTVLSQCNSQIILRIVNHNDLAAIGKLTEAVSEAELKMISQFTPGDCLLLGSAIPFPIMGRIRERSQ